ncbi:hypothetical protein [Flexivirga caeni]|uniref:Uncharacterized protein n=1 Tax=Flexivirga caeni TaxID=2294115 RepID=A0A3M9MCH1_9MICO|nr:hypothetical protein [Flexivirga caeni]RNI23224.1 hypothetical protein EFY87_07260 [Flexivirga caeni]
MTFVASRCASANRTPIPTEHLAIERLHRAGPAVVAVIVLCWLSSTVLANTSTVKPLITIALGCSGLGPWAARLLPARRHPA